MPARSAANTSAANSMARCHPLGPPSRTSRARRVASLSSTSSASWSARASDCSPRAKVSRRAFARMMARRR
ncbi:MAG: hypothetical protein EPO40_17500 [Myxococcaceae bacterium]|nr:MAG: hypothetical protein EPO40_17500 [Myxococcaceae bacterium]